MHALVQEALQQVDRLEVVVDILEWIGDYAYGEARKSVQRLVDAQNRYGEHHAFTRAAMLEASEYHLASQRMSLQYGERVDELEEAVITYHALNSVYH